MFKKLSRYGKFATAVALPLILVFTCVNVLLLSRHSIRDTTLILREKVYQKNGASDGTSSSNDGNRNIQRILEQNGPSNGNTVNKLDVHVNQRLDDGVRKTSGNDDVLSENVNNDVEEAEDVENPTSKNVKSERDRVPMRDETIDVMIEKLRAPSLTPFFPAFYENVTFEVFTKKLGSVARRNAPTLEGYDSLKP